MWQISKSEETGGVYSGPLAMLYSKERGACSGVWPRNVHGSQGYGHNTAPATSFRSTPQSTPLPSCLLQRRNERAESAAKAKRERGLASHTEGASTPALQHCSYGPGHNFGTKKEPGVTSGLIMFACCAKLEDVADGEAAHVGAALAELRGPHDLAVGVDAAVVVAQVHGRDVVSEFAVDDAEADAVDLAVA